MKIPAPLLSEMLAPVPLTVAEAGVADGDPTTTPATSLPLIDRPVRVAWPAGTAMPVAKPRTVPPRTVESAPAVMPTPAPDPARVMPPRLSCTPLATTRPPAGQPFLTGSSLLRTVLVVTVLPQEQRTSLPPLPAVSPQIFDFGGGAACTPVETDAPNAKSNAAICNVRICIVLPLIVR